MTIRALLFDLWGTLLYLREAAEEDDAQRRLLKRTVEGLAALGYRYQEERVAEALDAFSKELNAGHRAGRDVSQPERLEAILERIEPGLPARMPREAHLAFEDAVAQVRLRDRSDRLYPAPGASGALEEARSRGFGIGLVSITGLTPGYVLREVLAGHDLLGHFDVLTFSDEARMAKPTAEIFHCTLEVLDVAPEHAVFIGDTPNADIAGPQAIGMTAVQIGDREEDGITPDARIDSLDELFPALRRLGLVD